jgi:hypothetical protein
MKNDIRLDSLNYHIPVLQACDAIGFDRTAIEIECNLYLECDATRNPLAIVIPDLGEAEYLYKQLGEFIENARSSRLSK